MERSGFEFKIEGMVEGSKARVGRLRTPHGEVETPNFIFCGTKGALKGVTVEQAVGAGAEFILANTYHLMLNPGGEGVEKLGGIHRMMGWKGPMLTDSGGFQIFSLGHGGVAAEIKGKNRMNVPKTLCKIDREGATFRSYVDGKYYRLTPEVSIQVQRKIGADFVVVLDECTPFHVEKKYTAMAMRRSHEWELRSLREFERLDDGKQKLYGIVQGGVYEDLRKESAEFVNAHGFFGQAIGGSLGGGKEQMHDIVGVARGYLRDDRPTHLLGIGGIGDILHGVRFGIDTFDCVHPTRLARHGGALVRPVTNEGKEHINLKNSMYKGDDTPLGEEVGSYASGYSRGYIHYLFKANEHLAGTLLTIHNIAFMSQLARRIREGIRAGRFEEVVKLYLG